MTRNQTRASFCRPPLVGAFGACSFWASWTLYACAPISVDAFEEVAQALCPSGSLEPSGSCECSALTDTAACLELRAALRNLYTFDGAGTQIIDSASGMNGTLRHTVSTTPPADLEGLQVDGQLDFDGLGSYVELPGGMISSLGSATFEVWLTWGGGDYWARIFDFGSNDGAGRTYLFLTPWNSLTDTLRVAYSVAGNAAETTADAAAALPIGDGTGAPEHVAVVIDDSAGAMRLYLGGVEVSSVPLASDLGAIEDVNSWLGRSNFVVDPALLGTMFEFRIYNQALSAAQISTSFQAGPGALN